jgi:hypothetical protein
MKKINKIVKFSFSSKSFQPKMPNLRVQKPKPVDPKEKKNSNIYNLLASQKLLGSNSEIQNFYENTLTYTKSKKSAKLMLENFNSNKQNDPNILSNFNTFIIQNFNSKELETFFVILKDHQSLLENQEVEKTEQTFKIFIDKINSISSNKSIYS